MARHVAALIALAVWLLPLLLLIHQGQLLLATLGWRCLLRAPAASIGVFWRLRIAREGIDSLLPVAQVGGEIIGARLLARRGQTVASASASVVVDVGIELLTQIMFLLSGLACLVLQGGIGGNAAWLKILGGATATLLGMAVAQACGGLRALEWLACKMVDRLPNVAGSALTGLHASASEIYRNRPAVARSIGLHLLAWIIGVIETWIVLRAMHIPATALQALVIESLGMAARSAGFAIPAAIGAQEGGFVLAAAAVGIAAPPALALSVVKRLREIAGGLIGLALWRLEAARSRPSLPHSSLPQPKRPVLTQQGAD
jgi:putative membrane protein